jgi:cytochrome bd-type quinol oxidase subunit 1
MTPGDAFNVFAPFFFFALGFGLIQLVGLIFALVDILRREDRDVVGDSRVIWVVIVVFIPLAWAAYFLVGRR